MDALSQQFYDCRRTLRVQKLKSCITTLWSQTIDQGRVRGERLRGLWENSMLGGARLD